MTKTTSVTEQGLAGLPAQPVSPAQGPTPDGAALLLTVEEAARLLRVGRTTVFAPLRDGRLASVQIGSLRRIPLRCLERYVDGLGTSERGGRPMSTEDPASDHDGPGQPRRRRRGGPLPEALVLPFAGELPPPAP